MSLEAFICFHHVSLLIIDVLPMVWRSASALKAIDDSSESVQSMARGIRCVEIWEFVCETERRSFTFHKSAGSLGIPTKAP